MNKTTEFSERTEKHREIWTKNSPGNMDPMPQLQPPSDVPSACLVADPTCLKQRAVWLFGLASMELSLGWIWNGAVGLRWDSISPGSAEVGFRTLGVK
jgi:hypothetical protein